jgi:hypothetical protein
MDSKSNFLAEDRGRSVLRRRATTFNVTHLTSLQDSFFPTQPFAMNQVPPLTLEQRNLMRALREAPPKPSSFSPILIMAGVIVVAAAIAALTQVPFWLAGSSIGLVSWIAACIAHRIRTRDEVIHRLLQGGDGPREEGSSAGVPEPPAPMTPAEVMDVNRPDASQCHTKSTQ